MAKALSSSGKELIFMNSFFHEITGWGLGDRNLRGQSGNTLGNKQSSHLLPSLAFPPS